jgi:hypothetical protein
VPRVRRVAVVALARCCVAARAASFTPVGPFRMALAHTADSVADGAVVSFIPRRGCTVLLGLGSCSGTVGHRQRMCRGRADAIAPRKARFLCSEKA